MTDTGSKAHSFTCLNCGQEFFVTAAEAEAHGWTIHTVEHLGCTVTAKLARDPFDWSKATRAEIEDMANQLN